MQISVNGKQIDIGDALRTYVEETLEASVKKYFESPINANVVFSKEGNNIKADISVHPKRSLTIQGKAQGEDPYAVFDTANERVSTQLRRYKERIKNHKSKGDPELKAQKYVIASSTHEEEPAEEGAPVIVAEKATGIPTCSVSEAVMRLDLEHVNAIMFRNVSHGGLNVVYRREDGNIGWVDPDGAVGASKKTA